MIKSGSSESGLIGVGSDDAGDATGSTGVVGGGVEIEISGGGVDTVEVGALGIGLTGVTTGVPTSVKAGPVDDITGGEFWISPTTSETGRSALLEPGFV